MPQARYLIDTNVLIRWVQPQDPQFSTARDCIQHLANFAAVPCYTSQNLGEFWNVLTRPRTQNGYGLSPAQAEIRAKEIEARFLLLPDSIAVHQKWRQLLVAYDISGVQVHDARLVGAMLVHGVKTILTFNAKDFARYDNIEALHPSQVHG